MRKSDLNYGSDSVYRRYLVGIQLVTTKLNQLSWHYEFYTGSVGISRRTRSDRIKRINRENQPKAKIEKNAIASAANLRTVRVFKSKRRNYQNRVTARTAIPFSSDFALPERTVRNTVCCNSKRPFWQKVFVRLSSELNSLLLSTPLASFPVRHLNNVCNFFWLNHFLLP